MFFFKFATILIAMPYIEKIAVEKAGKLNSTPSIYGTFAEIGAGQEVVNHFFKAGKASQTVAKSMSAYDMIFSDQIYGRVGRYVSEKRLFKMLEHEYKLLEKRLKRERGHKTKFFAFADTVTVIGRESPVALHHGWMGIRFQSEYKGPYNEIVLHVNLMDKTRLQQYETLGVLGVNLIYCAFFGKKDHKSIVKSLFDNLEKGRMDIDVLRCFGKVFKKLNHKQLNMELIKQKATPALLFKPTGENIFPSDTLYEKNIVIQHLSHSPAVARKALALVKRQRKTSPLFLMNVPIQNVKKENIGSYFKKQDGDYKKYIFISNFKQLYKLKNFIRKSTDQYIYIILSLDILESVFKSSSVEELEFFGRLCDSKTILMIPKVEKNKKSHPLLSYLVKSKKVIFLK